MNTNVIIDYWMEKASDDLASALENGSAGRLQVAVRDAYFCCFHAFSALLLKDSEPSVRIRRFDLPFIVIMCAQKLSLRNGASISIGCLITAKKSITGHWLRLKVKR